MSETIKLGCEVKDRVTGFKGIAVSKTSYLQGCDRIAVQPKWVEGEVPKVADFDEPDLTVVGDGILPPVKPTSRNRGGPRLVVSPR